MHNEGESAAAGHKKGEKVPMTARLEGALRGMLDGFIGDPPDSDFQRGFLSAVLTVANEIAGVPYDDPSWARANFLLGGDDPKYVAAASKAKAKRAPFTVIDGGK